MAIALGIIIFLLHIYTLTTGHLHEDAYILFEYVQNILRGDGIVYFSGGERAEGATDFLWLILLSAISFITQLDVAVVAALLNSLGAVLFSYLCFQAIDINNWIIKLFAQLVLSLVIITSPLTAASLGGFSTLFYVSISLILVSLFWWGEERGLLLIPIFSIVLALIRPDGVIIGVSFCLIALYELRKSPLLKLYLLFTAVAGLVGVTYFFWRFFYFDNLLPLPLYVKVASSPNNTHGWLSNFSWLSKSYTTALIISFVALFFLVGYKKKIRLLKLSLPFVLLLLALGMSVQSQNIAYRFQGPIYGFLLFILTLLTTTGFASKRRVQVLIVALTLAIVAIQSQQRRIINEVDYLQSRDYINYLPFLLKGSLEESTKIALTEAGRMAFWNQAQTYDLVGLNTVETALHGVDADYLQRIKPDLIFVHTADTLKVPKVVTSKNWLAVDYSQITKMIDKPYSGKNHSATSSVTQAPLAVYQYLARAPEHWEVVMVKYGGSYSHLYALRKDSSLTETGFYEALEKSFNPRYQLPYWAARKHGY